MKHICNICGKEFETDEAYCEHKCDTGYTPKDMEHQDILTDGKFSEISEAALMRGEQRKIEN